MTLTVTEGSAADVRGIGTLVAEAPRDTVFAPGLTAEQIAENRKSAQVAEDTCPAAADDADRLAIGARVDGALAGFAVANRVDPAGHGLGWLTVIAANGRAISFYSIYGFEDAGPAPRDPAIARGLFVRPAATVGQHVAHRRRSAASQRVGQPPSRKPG